MELPQQLNIDLGGEIARGYELRQNARIKNLQMLAAQNELDQKRQLQALYTGVLSGDKQAEQSLAMQAPNAYESLQKQRIQTAQLGGKIAYTINQTPLALRNKVIADFKKSNPDLPISDQWYDGMYEAELAPLINQAREVEDIAKELMPEYKTEETSSGLMIFNKKTGEFKPATLEGKQLGIYQKPPSTVVNFNNTQESEYNKTIGKEFATIDTDFYKKITEKGQSAQNQKNSLDIIENSLAQIGTTGKLTGISANIANAANQLGIKVDTNKLANIETVQAEISKLVVPQAKDLGPNPSNTDRDFIGKMVPNLGNTQEANQLNILFSKKVIERNIQLDEAANQMRNAGKSPFEIRKALSTYNYNNPIFSKKDFDVAKNIGKQKNTQNKTFNAPRIRTYNFQTGTFE